MLLRREYIDNSIDCIINKTYSYTTFRFGAVAHEGPLLPVARKEEPRRPKKIKDALEADDFIPDKAGITREFKDLKNINRV